MESQTNLEMRSSSRVSSVFPTEYKNVFDEYPDCRIDYVLVHSKDNNDNDRTIRDTFEDNLRRKGLMLEEYNSKNLEKNKSVPANGYSYLKVHAPGHVLKQYCDILRMRMPVKNSIVREMSKEILNKNVQTAWEKFKRIIENILHYIDLIPRKVYKITAQYTQTNCDLFNDDADDFFSTSDRCLIVNFILEHGQYGQEDSDIGISKLLELGIYRAAYPPHEGTVDDKAGERGRLIKKWAQFKKAFTYQPIDDIKDYFGMKIALYYTWLGFYTTMLFPASLFGLLCFLYGFFTKNINTLSNEICDESQNIIMCPQCDKECDYWNITDACYYYQIRHYLDNYMTYFFAFFMSIWSALYLKMWKRYSSEITHRWGLTGFSLYAEQPRRQYGSCCAMKRKNDVTNNEEPYLPYWWCRFPCMILSYSVVLFWIFLIVICAMAIILFTMFLVTSDIIYETRLNKYKRTFLVPVTAAILNFIVINIMNVIYNKIAVCLTEMESQRTQVEYENSLQLKIYLFHFANYYSPIFYIAFLKGKLIGHPGSFNRILNYRQEECEPGGCLMEVCIQLATFMVAEQLWTNFVELWWPHIKIFLAATTNNFQTRMRNLCAGLFCRTITEKPKRWIEDIHLNTWDTELFDEYLEMVIQYGFVTIFVATFPLAPLLALLNNFFIEMRLDAKKYIMHYQRPVAQRVASIGIWFYIMKIIAKISILTNACIIAWSTHLVPMLLYSYHNNWKTDGFLNYSLAYFDVNDFENSTRPENTSFPNITYCRYPEFRSPPQISNPDEKYRRNFDYWHILVARLVFVVLYQNLVSFIVMLIQWIIPDMPGSLHRQIKFEEKYISDMILRKYYEQGQNTVHTETTIRSRTEHTFIHTQRFSEQVSNRTIDDEDFAN